MDEILVQVDDFRIRRDVRRDLFEALFRMIVSLHSSTCGFRNGNEQQAENCLKSKHQLITVCKRSLRRLCFYTCLCVHRAGDVCPIARWDTLDAGQTTPPARHPPPPSKTRHWQTIPPGQTPLLGKPPSLCSGY